MLIFSLSIFTCEIQKRSFEETSDSLLKVDRYLQHLTLGLFYGLWSWILDLFGLEFCNKFLLKPCLIK